jgi:hypothetical protein
VAPCASRDPARRPEARVVPSRIPLPPALGSGPFTVGSAVDAGLRPGRLRSPDLEAPTSGVRRRAADPVSDPAAQAASFALALPPDIAFSHLTAARLLDLPTPTPWPGPGELLDVMRRSRRPRIERTGCRHHRGLESRTVLEHNGVRVTDTVDTWCDLASRWREPDLLAAADVLLRRGWATSGSLASAVEARGSGRGTPRMRAVAVLARAGSASPGESHARWWFHHWGLPEPELNAPVIDDTGRWLATVDFLWRRQRVVGEYDGDVHRTDQRAWREDRERRAGLEDDGWRYVDLTALTLAAEHRRSALRRRLEALILG